MGCACSSSTKVPVVSPQPDLPLVDVLTRRVYTYFYPGSQEAREMLKLWSSSWSARGWSPVVLMEDKYKDHPMLPALRAKIKTLPTVNQRDYEDRCYLRWLAFDLVAPGVFTDYDVVNYDMWPENVLRIPEGTPRIYAYSSCGRPNPGLFVANQGGVRAMLYDFLHGDPPIDTIRGGQRHTSDLYYFFRNAERSKTVICPNVGYHEWKTAPAVHWNNNGIIKLGLKPSERSAAIREIRPPV